MRWLFRHLELGVWVAGLGLLYFMPVSEEHYSLCMFSALGFSWCPGCGIGHSLHYLLHFNLSQSWEAHYLGSFALITLLFRIFQLTKQILKPTYQPHE